MWTNAGDPSHFHFLSLSEVLLWGWGLWFKKTGCGESKGKASGWSHRLDGYRKTNGIREPLSSSAQNTRGQRPDQKCCGFSSKAKLNLQWGDISAFVGESSSHQQLRDLPKLPGSECWHMIREEVQKTIWSTQTIKRVSHRFSMTICHKALTLGDW